MDWETLTSRWTHLQDRTEGLKKKLRLIVSKFEDSEIRCSVWESLTPKTLVQGISLEGFLGYTEKDGAWTLVVRTLERDDKSGTILSSKVENLLDADTFLKESVPAIPRLLERLDNAVSIKGFYAIEDEVEAVLESKEMRA